MGVLLHVLLLLIAVFVIAFTYRDGLWNNALRAINILFAILLAINFWEPLAGILENMYAGATYFWDFLALWAIFCLSYVLLTLATVALSRVKLRFKMIMDRAGGIAAATIAGLLLMSFAVVTLHTAPLAEKFFYGGFDPSARLVFGLGPDRLLLSFCKYVSRGSLSRTVGEGQVNEFDPQAEFISKYATRRRTYEEYLKQNASGPRDLLVPEVQAPRRFRAS